MCSDLCSLIRWLQVWPESRWDPAPQSCSGICRLAWFSVFQVLISMCNHRESTQTYFLFSSLKCSFHCFATLLSHPSFWNSVLHGCMCLHSSSAFPLHPLPPPPSFSSWSAISSCCHLSLFDLSSDFWLETVPTWLKFLFTWPKLLVPNTNTCSWVSHLHHHIHKQWRCNFKMDTAGYDWFHRLHQSESQVTSYCSAEATQMLYVVFWTSDSSFSNLKGFHGVPLPHAKWLLWCFFGLFLHRSDS